MALDGIYVNGVKQKFLPSNILEGDISEYTEPLADAVEGWLDEHIHDGSAAVVDDTLSISGAAADAKKTGDEITQIKSDLTYNGKEAFAVFDAPGSKYEPFAFAEGESYIIESVGPSSAGFIADIRETTSSTSALQTLVSNGISGKRYIVTANTNGGCLRVYSNSAEILVKVTSVSDYYKKNSNFIITQRDVIKGDYNTPTEPKRIHMNFTLRVQAGDVIRFNDKNLYFVALVHDSSTAETRIESSGWLSGESNYTIVNDGYLGIVIANADTYTSSTAIEVSDFTGCVVVYNNFPGVIKAITDQFNMVGDEINHIRQSVNYLNDSVIFDIDETVTANTSYYITDLYVPKGAVISFENASDSSTCTINVTDGTQEQNITGNVPKGTTYTFVAPFDVVGIRSYVAGTTFKVRGYAEHKELYDIKQQISTELPSYFATEIGDTVDKITAACLNKSIVFPIITDSHSFYHGNDNWTPTVKNLAALNKKYKMDFVVHLGDVIEGNAEKSESISYLQKTVSDLLNVTDKTIVLTGNHEDNHVYYNNNQTGLITDAERYAILNRYNDIYVQRVGIKQYYYFDFANSDMDIRVICLDGLLGDGYPTGNNGTAWGYTMEQIAWVRDVALDTDKQVLFLSHIPLSSVYSSHYQDGYQIINSTELLQVISDFKTNGGIVIGFFSGHTHADWMAVNSIGVHEVQTGCQNIDVTGSSGQKSYNDGVYTPYVQARNKNSLTQELWDIVVVSPISRTVKIIRFGAGDDREFSY